MSSRDLIGAGELAVALGSGDAVAVDATVWLPRPRFDGDHQVSSGRDTWLERRIPGSRHWDLVGDRDLGDGVRIHFPRPDLDSIARSLDTLGIDPSTRIASYDQTGGFWAARLWWTLRSAGLAASVLDGGLGAWIDAGLAVEGPLDPVGEPAGPSREPAIRARLTDHPDRWATKSEVRQALDDPEDTRLVCALDPDVYSGAATSRYRRRGHIPGSVNVPARSLLGASGTLLRGDALATALGPAIEGRPHRIIAYCGGGISACAAALALVVAGETRVAVYDGSIEEWAADASLPLVSVGAPS